MLFDRFCEFLAATAAAQPILVIIDDVHWADTGSLLLLQFLAGRLADLPHRAPDHQSRADCRR